MRNSQEVATTIKKLAKDNNIAVGKLLSDCDLSKNALSTMQSGGYLPRCESLSKIADRLGCSVDYLLGRTDMINCSPAANGGTDSDFAVGGKVSKDENNLLNTYRILNSDGKSELLKRADELCSLGYTKESDKKELELSRTLKDA